MRLIRRRYQARRAHRAKAFTLIEIMMALMILAIGLSSVLSVFIVGLHASRKVVDESAAAVTAKAALSRVLAEDADANGERDFLERIELEREDDKDWVWMSRGPVSAASTPDIEHLSGLAGPTPPVDSSLPAPQPVAVGSEFSWRCRASRIRGEPGRPTTDMEHPTEPGEWAEIKIGRVPTSQENNPDSDELWRVTIQVFRNYRLGIKPLATFDTYVCTAHR